MKRLLIAAALAATALNAYAQDNAIPMPQPFKLDIPKDGSTVETEFQFVEEVAKPWNLCVLIPHLKDSTWVAFTYGVTQEVKRLGMKAKLFQAGSYNDLPKQVSQFENCITGGFDAILLAPISEAGLSGQIEKAKAADLPVIGFGNPIVKAPVRTQVMTPPEKFGSAGAEYLKKMLGGKAAKVVLLPGPLGAGWAEGHVAGFRKAAEGSGIEVLAEQFGEPSVATQLTLVENALQTYPNVDIIWGGATTIEAAVGVLADAGISDKTLVASYANQGTFDLLAQGKVKALSVQYLATEGMIAVDLAAKVLQNQEVAPAYYTTPVTHDAETLKELDLKKVAAPKDFQPIFSIE